MSETPYIIAQAETARLGTYPDGRFHGRGIVMCAGGLDLLANAYVTLQQVRRLSDLAVEIFYAGSGELPATVRHRLQTEWPSVSWRDITRQAADAGVRDFRGFHIKPYALLYSSFREVLYIDADNLPLAPLDTLFELPGYRRYGAQFWPDRAAARWTKDSLFEDLRLDPWLNGREAEFESGQMLVDKQRCWRALLYTCALNGDRLRAHVYRHTNGDKDTFRLGWRLADQDYAVVPLEPRQFGGYFLIKRIPALGVTVKIDHSLGAFYATGLLQHHPDGRPLFAHKTIMEWSPYFNHRNMTHVRRGTAVVADPALAALERQGYQDLGQFRRRYMAAFPLDAWKLCKRILRALLQPFLDACLWMRTLARRAKRDDRWAPAKERGR